MERKKGTQKLEALVEKIGRRKRDKIRRINPIGWCDMTLNPIVGCLRCSKGCIKCYAEADAYVKSHNSRLPDFKALIKGRKWSGEIQLYPERLQKPFKIKEPSLIFLNSMSDYFYEEVPLEFIQYSFAKIAMADWHFFQILTKRAERMHTLDRQLSWPKNLCMGVSVENSDAKVLERIDCLRETGAALKFISAEPLIGPLPKKLNLKGIDWLIAGGESAIDARPMKEEWVLDIRDQCLEQGVSFWFKQWSGRNPKRLGNQLQGQVWHQMPEALLKVREAAAEFRARN